MSDQNQISPKNNPENPIDLRHYLFLAWHWLWLFVLVTLTAGTAAYLFSRQLPPIYESSTTLLVMEAPTTSLSTDYSSILASQSLTKTYSDILTNQDVLQEVIDRLNLPVSASTLAGSINVSPVLNTQIIEIKVQDPNTVQAARIANTLVQVFLAKIQSFQIGRLSGSKENLQSQILEIEAQQQEVGKQRLDLNSQLLDINNQIKDTKDQFNILIQPTQQETQTASPAQVATETTQETTRLARVSELRTNLSNLQALALQVRQMNNTTDQLYYSLKTNYSVLQANLADIQSSNKVTQISLAQPSVLPVGPKVLQNTLIAALISLLLAIGGVIGLDSLDDTLRTPDDVVSKLNLPLLGVIFHHKIKAQPVTLDEPRSPISEGFRKLRTNIQYANVDESIRSILVTSSTPGEGKTTISTNLAIVFAQNGKRVYYVDADLRHPTVHKKMDLPNNTGLSQLVFNPESSPSAISQKGKVAGLNVITCGDLPPNPAELLGSKKMGLALEKLKADSDLVIFDTPPLLAVADPAVLAPAVDAVLLVVYPGKTRLRSARQALEQLGHVNARVIGVVLNGVHTNSHFYNDYYRRGY